MHHSPLNQNQIESSGLSRDSHPSRYTRHFTPNCFNRAAQYLGLRSYSFDFLPYQLSFLISVSVSDVSVGSEGKGFLSGFLRSEEGQQAEESGDQSGAEERGVCQTR